MTAPQRRAFLLTVLLAIWGALAVPLLGAVWTYKVDRPEFDLHVQVDESRQKATLEITLDILCQLKPADRRCK